MDQLRQSDISDVLAFVRDCHALCEIERFEDFLLKLVTQLAQLIPATFVTYNEMSPDKPESFNVGNTPEISTPKAAELWQQHMNEHPVVVHLSKTGHSETARISDFWSQRQLHDTGLYSEFYRYHNIEDALCITVPSIAPRVIGMGWHRDRCFTDRERLIADLIRPHITQAWQNAKLVSGMRRQQQLFKQSLEFARSGVILSDTEGRVQFINDLARQQLIEYFRTSQHQENRLPPELFDWMRHQNAQLRKNEVPLVQLPLTVEKGDKCLTIRLLSNSGATLLILEEQSPAADGAALEHFGLSRRESEVLAWVAQGKTNGEIATILNMSVGTTKKHLEHIFQKLGVETRTAAAAMARPSSV